SPHGGPATGRVSDPLPVQEVEESAQAGGRPAPCAGGVRHAHRAPKDRRRDGEGGRAADADAGQSAIQRMPAVELAVREPERLVALVWTPHYVAPTVCVRR